MRYAHKSTDPPHSTWAMFLPGPCLALLMGPEDPVAHMEAPCSALGLQRGWGRGEPSVHGRAWRPPAGTELVARATSGQLQHTLPEARPGESPASSMLADVCAALGRRRAGFPEPAPVGEAGLRAESPVHYRHEACTKSSVPDQGLSGGPCWVCGHHMSGAGRFYLFSCLVPTSLPARAYHVGFYHPLPAGRPGSGRPARLLGAPLLTSFHPSAQGWALPPDSH